jgi:predicted amidophosphoribosyltransferase
MAETLRCPSCGAETEPDARKCGKCQYPLKSELECLRSIDRSVGIIKRILIWWLVVSFLGAAAYLVSHPFTHHAP